VLLAGHRSSFDVLKSDRRIVERHSFPAAGLSVGKPFKAVEILHQRELKRILATWGINPREGCKCIERANEMDRKGTAWCRDNVDAITGWLREEARKRGWHVSLLATLGARRLVLQAIKQAEDAKVGASNGQETSATPPVNQLKR
jgi:hypothetical protein